MFCQIYDRHHCRISEAFWVGAKSQKGDAECRLIEKLDGHNAGNDGRSTTFPMADTAGVDVHKA